MKLAQMEYFLAAAQELNFTAAARRLYISQPALSKQIVVLEQELGVKLFTRNSRKVALTAAGLQLQRDLHNVLDQLEQAKQRAIGIGKRERLKLSIGCFDGAVTDDFLPLILNSLHGSVPGIQVTLSRNTFRENRTALRHGEIDVLLTLSTEASFGEEYEVRKILCRRGALTYSVKSPLARKSVPEIGDFLDEQLLVIKRSEAPDLYLNTVSEVMALGISCPKVQEVDNFATLAAYLELGAGYAILTDLAAEKDPDLRCVVPENRIQHWVVAVWKKNHPMAGELDRCLRAVPPEN